MSQTQIGTRIGRDPSGLGCADHPAHRGVRILHVGGIPTLHPGGSVRVVSRFCVGRHHRDRAQHVPDRLAPGHISQRDEEETTLFIDVDAGDVRVTREGLGHGGAKVGAILAEVGGPLHGSRSDPIGDLLQGVRLCAQAGRAQDRRSQRDRGGLLGLTEEMLSSHGERLAQGVRVDDLALLPRPPAERAALTSFERLLLLP